MKRIIALVLILSLGFSSFSLSLESYANDNDKKEKNSSVNLDKVKEISKKLNVMQYLRYFFLDIIGPKFRVLFNIFDFGVKGIDRFFYDDELDASEFYTDDYKQNNKKTTKTDAEIKEKSGIVFSGNKRYILNPNKKSYDTSTNFENKTLNFDELSLEYYDKKKKDFTNQSVNYNSGDELIVRDTISNIEYLEDDDSTVLEFKTKNFEYDHALGFAGDLRKKYKVGDEIEFKFIVERTALVGSDEFTEINYSIYVLKNGKNPAIDDYLNK